MTWLNAIFWKLSNNCVDPTSDNFTNVLQIFVFLILPDRIVARTKGLPTSLKIFCPLTFPRSPYYEKRKGKMLQQNFALRFFPLVESLLTKSRFLTHSFILAVCSRWWRHRVPILPTSLKDSAHALSTVGCLVGGGTDKNSAHALFQRSPYYEKRKGKILQKNFALRFFPCGVSIDKISVLDTFFYPGGI